MKKNSFNISNNNLKGKLATWKKKNVNKKKSKV